MRGLASALAASPTPWLFVIAGDMPWPDPALILRQAELAIEAGPEGMACEGVCLKGIKGPEPFHAFYRSRLADETAEAVRKSKGSKGLSMRGWIEAPADAESGADLSVGVEFPQMFSTRAHHRSFRLDEASFAQLLASERNGVFEFTIDEELK